MILILWLNKRRNYHVIHIVVIRWDRHLRGIVLWVHLTIELSWWWPLVHHTRWPIVTVLLWGWLVHLHLPRRTIILLLGCIKLLLLHLLISHLLLQLRKHSVVGHHLLHGHLLLIWLLHKAYLLVGHILQQNWIIPSNILTFLDILFLTNLYIAIGIKQ